MKSVWVNATDTNGRMLFGYEKLHEEFPEWWAEWVRTVAEYI